MLDQRRLIAYGDISASEAQREGEAWSAPWLQMGAEAVQDDLAPSRIGKELVEAGVRPAFDEALVPDPGRVEEALALDHQHLVVPAVVADDVEIDAPQIGGTGSAEQLAILFG